MQLCVIRIEDVMLDIDRIQAELNTSISAPAPLYERLRAAINAQITDGTLKTGEALPSEQDIEQRLGISHSTLLQAIRLLIEDGHLQSVPGAGTFVVRRDPKSISQPISHSRVIGVLAEASSFYLYYGQLASVFNHRLRQAGYHVDLALYNSNPDDFVRLIDSFLAADATAIAINPPSWFDITELIHQLQASDIKVVLIGRRMDFPDVDYVGTDNRLLGYQATRHLIDLGHAKIINISIPRYSSAQDRAEGYVLAMLEAGLSPHIYPHPMYSYMENLPTPVHLIQYVKESDPAQVWTDMVNQDITAAFCFNDETAIWVQKGLRHFNLEVPKDISLVGVDNLPFVFDVPLTTFALPGEAIGNKAAEILLKR